MSDCFHKGQAFNIADGSANFNDSDIDTAIQLEHSCLDFIRNMGDDLNGPAEILAPPFFCYDRIVNSARGIIVNLGHDSIGIALVMTHIKIGFGAIIGNVYFAMLKRVHGAWIDIDIGVKLLECDG